MTTAEEAQAQGEELGRHIAAMLKDSHPGAEVRINPTIVTIPPHIAGNILEFLRRVQVTGMESIAWAEAYSFIGQYAPAPAEQPKGVPFTGLPNKA